MSDKTAEKKPVTFKADLLEASAKAASNWTVDGATGVMTLEAGVIETMLPEGQTLKSHLEHQEAMDLIKSALTHSGLKPAGEAFKANKDLETITFKVPTFGKNYVEAEFRRHGISRPFGGVGEATTYAGAIGYSKHEVVSTRPKSEFVAMKDQFKSLAAELGL